MTIDRARFDQGLTYEAYKDQMTRNRDRLEENEQRVDLSKEDLAAFRALPRAELEHEGLRQLEGLRLVAALGAVRDLDLVRDRGHAATRVAISRSSRTTSALANLAVSSRIFASSAWSRSRASSAS